MLFLLEDFLTVSQICQQICFIYSFCIKGTILLIFLLADLLNVYQICQQICLFYSFCIKGLVLMLFLLADLLTVAKPAGRNRGYFCQQLYWPSKNLLAEIGWYFCWQIYWLSAKSAQKNCFFYSFCIKGLVWMFFLSADLLTVTKYASRNWVFSYHQICWL